MFPELEAELEWETDLERSAPPQRGFGEYEIFGTDDRLRVTNTLQIPFRFVCCIAFDIVHPTTGNRFALRGSGTLISDRHVLTAAHNVLNDHSFRPGLGFPLRYIRSTNIRVAPARNDRDLPGHDSEVQTVRVPPQWQAAANRQTANGNTTRVFAPPQCDYALLTLRNPLGARQPDAPVTMQLPAPPVAWWGHPQFGGNTRIRVISEAVLRRLRGETVNVAGYPTDKCRRLPARGSATPAQIAACTGHIPGRPEWADQGSTQWHASGRIINPLLSPGLFTFDADMTHGQSGGPVWLNWQGFRNLLAVNTGGSPRSTAPFDIIANQGVRITEVILQRLRAWMRLDRVRPNF